MSRFEKARDEDLKKIDLIKKQYDLSKNKDLLDLFSALQTGQIVFETSVGKEFDDEVFQMVEALKSQKFSEDKHNIKANKLTDKSEKINVNSSKKKIVVLTKKELMLRRLILTVLFLIALTCLGYFGVYCYDSWRVDKESRRLAQIKENSVVNDMYADEEIQIQVGEELKSFKVLDQYKSLYNSNKTLIGWLKIADTIIDYPVMQNGDNTYYLEHNSNLEEDRNGALFLDCKCDIKSSGTNFIIYGHNMKSGKMFGSLDKYENSTYFEKHRYIQFDTIYEEGIYEVMYVFRSKVYKQEEIVFKYYQFYNANSEEEFQSYMNEMKAISLYDTGVSATYGDSLLTLSTCDYVEKDGRFVVVAKRVN